MASGIPATTAALTAVATATDAVDNPIATPAAATPAADTPAIDTPDTVPDATPTAVVALASRPRRSSPSRLLRRGSSSDAAAADSAAVTSSGGPPVSRPRPRRSSASRLLRRGSLDTDGADRAAARTAEAAAEERFVVGAPESLAQYVTPATDLGRLREPVLATVPYGAASAGRPADIFVLHGNAGRGLLRDLHTIMASMQSNTYVLAEHHLMVLHERWVLAARSVRLYLLVADRVWGGWVAAADARAAAAADAEERTAPMPVKAALERLSAALAASTATWARFADADRADLLLPTLWGDLHALTAAAAAAYRRVEATLPAEVVATASAPGGRRGAKRRADAAAMAYARGVFGPSYSLSGGPAATSLGATAAASVGALIGLTHWIGAPEWTDHLAATHLRGGSAARAAYDAALDAFRARRAEVMAFFSATAGPPVALPRHLLPTPDPARMMFHVLPVPIGV